MGIEQDPECRWDVLRIIFGDGFRDMFLNFTKTSFSTILFKTNMVIFKLSTQLCNSTECQNRKPQFGVFGLIFFR